MSEMQIQTQEPDPEDGPFCRFCKDVRCVADVELGDDGRPTGRGIWVCPECCWSPDHEDCTTKERGSQ